MTFEQFRARLEGMGARFDTIVVDQATDRSVRYFMLGGNYATIDAGDLKYLTPTTIKRICQQLGLDEKHVCSSAH